MFYGEFCWHHVHKQTKILNVNAWTTICGLRNNIHKQSYWYYIVSASSHKYGCGVSDF